ncbi:MAG: hypothetical protein Q4C13_03960 [Clostridia bacterium]|nr:hypothetical protein [Clostridia bacterium]
MKIIKLQEDFSMKKPIALLLAALLLPAALACRAEPAAELPNPVRPAEAGDFAALGLALEAVEGAENLERSVIAGEIAEMRFDYEGRAYTYRTAVSQEDISGVYESFDEEALGMEADGADWYASVTVRSIRGGEGGALAAWRYGDAQYTLYTGDAVAPEAVGNLAVALAEKVCPRQAAD